MQFDICSIFNYFGACWKCLFETLTNSEDDCLLEECSISSESALFAKTKSFFKEKQYFFK